MAAILLDVDGVLHVSGEAIPGAADAVSRLRDAGHRLRFVTNSTTRPRAELAQALRKMGIEVADDELQTTADSAARLLAGRRVLALTMPAIVPDLHGIELVGEGAEAVLIGGAGEGPENNRVFSFMNLARAFAELDAGAELYALHKNRWWQTQRGPLSTLSRS
jgi:ribonucleotide monophosphatase NagD (HAD superfamily)